MNDLANWSKWSRRRGSGPCTAGRLQYYDVFMVRGLAIVATVTFTGCWAKLPTRVDRDGDGSYACGTYGAGKFDCDCDDQKAEINPSAPELVDNCVDENCDDALGYDTDGPLGDYLAPDDGRLGGAMLCATADSEANPQLGAALVTAANEGEPALAVGAPKRNHAGVVYFVPNGVMKAARGELIAVEHVADYTVQGDENSEAGSALALLDVDAGGDDAGTGGDELFIGAPAQSLAGTGARGAVFMLSATDWQSAPTLTFQDNTGCPAGVRFCIVGDDNYTGTRLGAGLVTGTNDGDPYLLVSAPGYYTTENEQALGAVVRVTQFEGRQTLGDEDTKDATLAGWSRGEGFGAAMAVADVDGDGSTEVIVSANGSDAGDGVTGGALFAAPLAAEWGPQADLTEVAQGGEGVTGMGTALAVAPDLLGDGYDALVASTSCPPTEQTSCTYQVHVLTFDAETSVPDSPWLSSYLVIDWTDLEGGPIDPANLLVRQSQDTYTTLFISGPTYGGGSGALWAVPDLANHGATLHLDDEPPIVLTSGEEGDPFAEARLGASMARAWWDTDDDDGLAVGAPHWSNSSGAVVWFSGGSLF